MFWSKCKLKKIWAVQGKYQWHDLKCIQVWWKKLPFSQKDDINNDDVDEDDEDGYYGDDNTLMTRDTQHLSLREEQQRGRQSIRRVIRNKLEYRKHTQLAWQQRLNMKFYLGHSWSNIQRKFHFKKFQWTFAAIGSSLFSVKKTKYLL